MERRAAVLLALAIACAPPGRTAEPGVLVVMESEQTAAFVSNFNPLLEVGTVRWPTRRAMYEPLLIFNPMTGTWTPWLAERHAWSDDARTLRFELRAGVRWSDGAPFTATDVLFTFELLRAHALLDLRGIWTHLESVTADGTAVVFRFRRALVPVLEDIAHQPIVPAHVWRHVADPVAFTNDDPVATGPFTEVSSFHAQAYQVDRNPYYWGGVPKVTGLRFLAFPANDQSNLALVRGEVDWAGNFVPAIDRVYVGRNPGHHRYWFPLIDGTVMLYANTTRAPWSDARVRRAVSMAIDRERIVRIAMFDYTRPADATGLSDLYARYRDPAVAGADWVRFDRERARAELAAAGLEPGWDATIIVPAGYSDWVRAANLIARDLRAVGIDAHFRTYDPNTWYQALQTGEYDLSLGWTEPSPTPYGFYRNLMSAQTVRPIGDAAGANWHRYAAPAAEPLLAELERTADAEVERRAVAGLQRLFAAEAPAIPLFPGPMWAEYSTEHFTGFPDAADPYAPPSPNAIPQPLLVVGKLVPR